MDDDLAVPSLAKVLDLTPAIKRKKIGACRHTSVEVDMDLTEITCAGCGGNLDAWQYLRDLALREAEEIERKRKVEKDFAAWVESFKVIERRCIEKIDRYNKEISHLVDVKNRLYNEPTNTGRILGQVAHGVRKRKTRSTG